VVLFLAVLLNRLFGLLPRRYQQKLYRPLRNQSSFHKNQRKLWWVVKKLISIKAHNPTLGSRAIADIFNRQYGYKDTVCHSTVCKYLRIHQADIELKRRRLEHKRLFITPNHSWDIDLQAKPVDERKRWLLNMIDYALSLYLFLEKPHNKTSITAKTKPFIAADGKPNFTKGLFRAFWGIKRHPPDD